MMGPAEQNADFASGQSPLGSAPAPAWLQRRKRGARPPEAPVEGLRSGSIAGIALVFGIMAAGVFHIQGSFLLRIMATLGLVALLRLPFAAKALRAIPHKHAILVLVGIPTLGLLATLMPMPLASAHPFWTLGNANSVPALTIDRFATVGVLLDLVGWVATLVIGLILGVRARRADQVFRRISLYIGPAVLVVAFSRPGTNETPDAATGALAALAALICLGRIFGILSDEQTLRLPAAQKFDRIARWTLAPGFSFALCLGVLMVRKDPAALAALMSGAGLIILLDTGARRMISSAISLIVRASLGLVLLVFGLVYAHVSPRFGIAQDVLATAYHASPVIGHGAGTAPGLAAMYATNASPSYGLAGGGLWRLLVEIGWGGCLMMAVPIIAIIAAICHGLTRPRRGKLHMRIALTLLYAAAVIHLFGEGMSFSANMYLCSLVVGIGISLAQAEGRRA